MMKKIFKILLAIISIVVVGVLMLYLFTNKFERKLNVLDCEGVYYKGLFGSENSFKIESDINDAKGNIAKCLCEKYVINKKKEYKKEILILFEKYQGGIVPDAIYKNPNHKIDSICKYREMIFTPIEL